MGTDKEMELVGTDKERELEGTYIKRELMTRKGARGYISTYITSKGAHHNKGSSWVQLKRGSSRVQKKRGSSRVH